MLAQLTPSRLRRFFLFAASRGLLSRFATAAFGALCALHAHGASETWVATPTDATWLTTTNWSGGAVPGSVNPAAGALSNDLVTFNTALSGTIGGASNPIINDNQRNIKSILFDTASVGPYVIGTLGGNQLQLSTTGTGTGNITMSSTVISPEVINAPILLRLASSTNGAYTFVNNAVPTSANLTIANVADGSAATRPVTLTLDGSNSGNNTLGLLTQLGAIVLIKNGTGTWILPSANTLTQQTSAGVAASVTVNNGVLALQNASSLGTITGVTISGGIMRLDNITPVQSSVTVTAGGVVGNGTSTINGMSISASATNITLGTTNPTDLLTVGNATNKYTGTTATNAVTHITGPGTVLLGFGSNYAGSWSVDSGTLRLGTATSLGPVTTSVAFGAGSTGTLQLIGNSITVAGLNSNATVGSPVVQNGAATAATLTLNNASANTYSGVIQNGSTGSLALVKNGAGVLNLGGTSTYTGGTSINAGTLIVSNGSGSATGTGAVNLASTVGLSGAGSIAGTVTTGATSTISPGAVTAGNAGSGTLSVGNLTMSGTSTATFNFGLSTSNPTNSLLSTGALIFPSSANSATLNLWVPGTTNPFAQAGTYDLFQYSTIAGGSPSSIFTFGTSIAGFTPSFGTAAGPSGTTYITLTLTAAGVLGVWTGTGGDTNWTNTANWQGGNEPGAPGDSATFNDTAGTPGTVTLNAPKTVGGVSFSTTTGSYTIASDGTDALTIDNNGSAATIADQSGNHTMAPALILNSPLTVSVANSQDTLTVSGVISDTGTHALTKSGNGLVILSSANSYAGGTVLTAGTLNFATGALGSGALTLSGGTLQWAGGNTQDISSLGITVAPAGGTFDTNGNNVTLASDFGGGGAGPVTKVGNGVLTLLGTNTFTGAYNANGGITNFGNLTNLGAGTALTFNGGTLQWATGTTTDISSRTVTFNSLGGTLDTNGNNVTLAASIGNGGAGGLTKTGNGNLSLTAVANYLGNTTVNQGTLSLGIANATPATGVTVNSGAILSLNSLAQTFGELAGTGNVTLGSAALLVGDGNNNSFGGNISGTGSLTKQGAGQMTITGNNTYTGTTTVNAGTLEIATGGGIHGSTLGGQGFLVDGGTLTATGTSTFGTGTAINETAGNITTTGTFQSNANDGTLFLITGGTFTGSISLQRTASFTTAPTAAAPIAASTTNGLYVNGAGATVNLNTLTIGTNNSSASARIDAGSLLATGEILIGHTSNSRWSILQVNGGTLTNTDTVNGLVITQNNGTNPNNAELYLSGGTTTAQRIAFGVSSDTAANTGWLIVGNATLSANLYVGSGGIVQPNTVGQVSNIALNNGLLGAVGDWSSVLPMQLSGNNFTIQAGDSSNVAHNITLSGTLSGLGNITKSGNGALTLSGANTMAGTMTVNGGTLSITSITNGGLGISSTFANNSTLVAVSSTAGLNVGQNVAGTGIPLGTTITAVDTTNSTVTLSATPTANSTAALSYFTANALGGSSNSAASLTLNGGTLQYTGITASSNRSFTIGNGATIDASGTGNLTLTSTAPVTYAPSNINPVTLGFSGNNTGNNTFAALIADNGALPTSVTKNGTGQWALTNANTYTGPTTINAGTLQAPTLPSSVTINSGGVLTGPTAINGSLTVNSGGNLTATGTASGALSIASGATLQPGGNSTGSLTVGSANLASGSLLNFIFGSNSNYDQVFVTNDLTFNPNIQITLLNPNLGPSTIIGNFTLFTFGTTFTGDPNDLVVQNEQRGLDYLFAVSGSNIVLEVASAGLLNSWNSSIGGSWGTGSNWSNNAVPPNTVTINFFSSLTQNGTVELDGNRSAQGLVFSNVNSYTIAADDGNGGNLTLNNGSSPADVQVLVGNHTISAPLTLTAAGMTANVTAGNVLTISGVIGQNATASLTNNGNGTLMLTGLNTYTGPTTLNGSGTTIITSIANGGVPSPIGQSSNAASNLVINGPTLRYTGPGNSTNRLFTIGTNATLSASGTGPVVFTNPGNLAFLTPDNPSTLTLSGNNTGANTLALSLVDNGLGATSLTKRGSGLWAVTGTNSYTGVTTINGGTLQINSIANGSANQSAATVIGPSNLTADTSGGCTTIIVSDDSELAIGQSLSGPNIPTGTIITNLDGGDVVEISNPANSTASGVAADFAGFQQLSSLDTSTLVVGQTVTGFGIAPGSTILSIDSPTQATISLAPTATSLNSASLNFFTANSLGGPTNLASNLVINGGTLQYVGSGASTDRLFTVGPSNATIDSSGSGPVAFNGTGSLAFNGTAGATLTFTGNNTGGNNTFAPAITNAASGNTTVVKSGNNTWTLTGTNTYSGGTVLSGGTLQISSGASLGANNANLSIGNGTTLEAIGSLSDTRGYVLGGSNTTILVDDGFALTIGGAVTGTGPLNFIGNGTLGSSLQLNVSGTYTGGTNVYGGTLVIGTNAANVAGTGNITLINANLQAGIATFTIPNNITVPAGDTDQLTITGSSGTSNSFSGLLTGSGTLNVSLATLLSINTANAFGNFNGTFNVNTNSGGGIRLVGTGDHNFSNATVNLNAGTLLTRDGGTQSIGALNGAVGTTLGGTSVGAGLTTWQIGNLNTNSVFSGVITNGNATGTPSGNFSGVTKVGTGMFTLNGTNTYSGPTIISAGTLQVGTGGSTGTLGTASAVTDNANLVFNRSDAAYNVSNAIGGNGTLTMTGGGLVALSGTNTYTGSTTIAGGTLSVASLANGGVSSGLGASTSAASNLVLNAGTLQYTGAAASTDRSFTIASGSATLDASGTGAINFSNTTATAFADATPVTLTLTGTNAGSNTLAANLGDNGSPTAVVKNGPGQWILTNPTYTGATTVNAGILQTILSGGSALVNAGATLNATGSAGALTVDGTFSPGSGTAVGNLSASSALLASGSSLDFLFNSTSSYDQLFVSGSLEIDPTVSLTLLNASLGPWSTVGNFNLFTFGSLTGTPANLVVANQLSYLNYALVQNGSAIQLQITSNTSLPNTWANTGGGSWSIPAGNWTGNTLPSTTAPVNFVSSITANSTVTLDGDHTAAGLLFGNPNSYTIAQGTGGNLTLSNAGSAATVEVDVGNHTISAPVILSTGGLSANVASGYSLTISGSVGENAAGSGVTTIGPGTLVLSGVNSYTGVTTINAGTLDVTTLANGGLGSSLGESSNSSSNLVLNGGTLRYLGTGSSTDRLFTIGSIANLKSSGTGPVSFTNTGSLALLNNTSNAALTFSGNNTGANIFDPAIVDGVPGITSVVKSGSGTWVLGGVNTYSGGTTLTNGTLDVTGSGTLGSSVSALSATNSTLDLGGTSQSVGAVTLANSTIQNGTLTGASYSLQSGAVSAALAGTGAVTKSTTGSVTLSGLNTYTGATTITTGTLIIGGSGLLGSGGTYAGAIADGATLVYATSGNQTLSGVISGVGTLTQSGTGKLTLSAANSFTGNVVINSGTISNTNAQNATAPTVSGLGNPQTVGRVITINNGGTLSLDIGNEFGAGASPPQLAFTVNAGGVMQATASNRGIGNLTLNGGTVSILAPGQTTSAVFDSFEFANLVTVGGTSASLINSISNGAGYGVNLGINVTAGYQTPFNVAVTGASGPDLIVNAVLTNSGSNGSSTGLIKNGAGTMEFTAPNTYSNVTTINAGTLQLGDGTTGHDGTIAGTGIVNNGTLIYNIFGTPAAYAGSISGTGPVIKNGVGSQTLTGTNTYAGGTTINTGTLQIGNGSSGSLVAGGNVTINSSATLALNLPNNASSTSVISNNGNVSMLTTGTNTLFGVVSGTGNLTQSGIGTAILAAADSYTGATTVTAGTLQIGNFTAGSISSASAVSVGSLGTLAIDLADGSTFTNPVTNNGSVKAISAGANTFSGVISGTGSFVQSGAGLTTLAVSNTFTGGVVINAGTLVLGNAGALNSTNPNAVTFGASSTADLRLNGNSVTVAGLATNTIAGFPVVEDANPSPVTLTVNNTVANTFSGIIQDGAGGGSLSLLKIGLGAFNLPGTYSYTGSTTVGSGNLVLTGTLSSSPVTVNSGGILAGNGTINSNLTLAAGGKLYLGPASTNTFNAGNFTWNTNGSGSLLFALSNSANTNDVLNIAGSFVKGASSGSPGQFVFDFQGTGFFGGVYTLVDWASGENVGFTVNDFAYVNLPGSLGGNFTLNDGSLVFNISTVPEPATWALLLGAGTLLTGLWRKRKHSR